MLEILTRRPPYSHLEGVRMAFHRYRTLFSLIFFSCFVLLSVPFNYLLFKLMIWKLVEFGSDFENADDFKARVKILTQSLPLFEGFKKQFTPVTSQE